MVVGQVLGRQHNQCPDQEHIEKLEEGDVLIVDDAPDNAPKHKVLHLIDNGAGRQIPFAGQLNLDHKSDKPHE